MIPLRPTINLYYDKIVDETPIPNGVSNYGFTRDTHCIPYNKDSEHPVNPTTLLFNVLKALEVPRVNIFSGKETAKNLFYPIELNAGYKWNVDLTSVIPKKTRAMIQKGKMKLLIFAPRISHDYHLLWKLRQRLDFLSTVGITREMTYIVLGDLNRCYRKLFDNPNVYGIDWWQIYTQIAYKSRYREQDWHWVFRDKASHPVPYKQIEAEEFKFENWKPKRIFTALTGNTALHNISFVSEMLYRKLDTYGDYSFNLDANNIGASYRDFRVTDKTRGQEYLEAKQKIIESLKNTSKIIDTDYEELKKDPLRIDSNIFNDSLINIVSGSYMPMYDKNYLDEIDVISPGVGIWRQIAKGHPFMSLGCLNTMGYISNEGYFLPTPIVNQVYDRVSKIPKKVSLICDNIEMLTDLTEQEIKDKVEELIPFMQRNKEKFFNFPNKRKFEKLFSEMAYE